MSAYACAVGHAVAALTASPAVTALVGDRVFEGIAPDGAAYPLVLVQRYTGPTDTRTHEGVIYTTVDLAVRAFAAAPGGEGGSLAQVLPIADAVHAALDGSGPVTRPDGVVHACSRVGELASTEQRGGSVIRGLGGRYRVVVGRRLA